MGISRKSLGISAFWGLALLCAGSAQAFWIGDHDWLTDQAVQGLQLCGFLPRWDAGWAAAVRVADEREDLDLFRKWTHYSHYFHPSKQLAMWRADSSVTIAEATAALEAILLQPGSRDLASAFSEMGRIVHHLQDAAVPAHVVPVNHFLHDGFEAYDPGDLAENPLFSPADCATLKGTDAPGELLRETALATLAALRGSFEFRLDGRLQSGLWEDLFWAGGEGSAFGAYGLFGNNFGSPSFEGAFGHVEVEQGVYREFKRRQLRAAMLATERAILWLDFRMRASP